MLEIMIMIMIIIIIIIQVMTECKKKNKTNYGKNDNVKKTAAKNDNSTPFRLMMS